MTTLLHCRHLDATDPSLADRITRLATGEAIVKVAGQRPVLVRLAQHHRDAAQLAAPPANRTDDEEAS